MAESMFIKVDEVGELLGISRVEAYMLYCKAYMLYCKAYMLYCKAYMLYCIDILFFVC